MLQGSRVHYLTVTALTEDLVLIDSIGKRIEFILTTSHSTLSRHNNLLKSTHAAKHTHSDAP